MIWNLISKWQRLLIIAGSLAVASASNGQTNFVTSNIAGIQRVTLSEGRNFVAAPLIPVTNTLAGVVGATMPANTTNGNSSS